MSLQISEIDNDVLGATVMVKGSYKESMAFFDTLLHLGLEPAWLAEPQGHDFIEGCISIERAK